MLKSWHAKQTMSLWEVGQMILIPITWKYMFLLLRCVWVCAHRHAGADTDWQIETVTVLWVQIVGCQSANQPWPICNLTSYLVARARSPRSLARLPLFSVSYRERARVCVRVCVFIISPFPHFSRSSYLFNSGYDLSRNFLPCDLSPLPPLLPHNDLFPSLKRLQSLQRHMCVYGHVCLCLERVG